MDTSATSPRTVLDTIALTRKFDDLVAVDHVTFSVTEGEVMGLVGLNGAGKTTLIKMLITLIQPTSGSAHVCGFDIRTQASSVRQAIGYVPQLVSADGDLTGRENLMVYARLYGVPHEERRARVETVLEFMDLKDVGDKLVREFSGGMIRRLEIAQSMLHRPHLLFLDEPTVGLDPVARDSVWQHILELRQDFGTTILLTTHLLDEVESLCDRVAIMTSGKMVAIGTVPELRRQVDPEATMDEVFVHFAGTAEQEAGFRAAGRARRTARRLG